MGEKAVHIGEQLRQEIKSETDRLYLQYKNEKTEYVEKMQKDGNTENLYKIFDDELYKSIFKKYMKIKNKELADRIGTSEESDISRYKNLTTKDGKRYKQADSFLGRKENVINLGLALKLPFVDFCRFIWSRSHAFPTDIYDYALIEQIKKKENMEYSEPKIERDL